LTKIASMTPPIPRGKIIGKQVGGPPLSDTDHFWKCEACGGWFDMRDLGAVLSRGATAASVVRSSAVASQGHQRSVVMRRRDERGTICACQVRGHHEAALDGWAVVKVHMKEAAN